jgi:hypothetical protein
VTASADAYDKRLGWLTRALTALRTADTALRALRVAEGASAALGPILDDIDFLQDEGRPADLGYVTQLRTTLEPLRLAEAREALELGLRQRVSDLSGQLDLIDLEERSVVHAP